MTSPSGSTAAGQALASDGVRNGLVTATADRATPVATPELPGVTIRSHGTQDRSRTYDPGPRWARYLPSVAALLLCLWGIKTPSFWRDEAATVAAISRPFPDMIRMLGNVDAVHSLYYIMMWPLAHMFGATELVLRFPSAVAAAVAAGAVAAIGRRVGNPWVGLMAGLVLAFLPVTSRYGQEARSYEMVVAVATIASYLLLRVLQADAPQRRRWIIWYGASVALLGCLNIFGLLLVPAHALTVLLHWRRDPRNRDLRKLAISWVVAAGVGVAICSPLLVLGWMQRAQIAWLSVNTSTTGFNTIFSLAGSYLVTTGLVAVLAVALVLSLDKTKAQRRATWPWNLLELSLPWLIVPPLILFAASLIHPVYTSRYVLMCIPPLALLLAAAISSFRRTIGLIALGVIVVSGATEQLVVRGPAGHFDDIRGLDSIVANNSHPGDAVLYTNPNSESFGAAYTYGLGKLRNVGMSQGPIPSGTLAGSTATLPQIRAKLLHVKRLWVVEMNTFTADPYMYNLKGEPVDNASPILEGLPFTFTQMWREKDDYLILFTHY
jgi:mannosyltransferase